MQSLFLRYSAAPLVIGVTLLVTITTTLLVVDAFSPENLPPGFSSTGQLMGINLLLVLVPAYLISAWGLLHRRSWVLLGQVDKLPPGHDFQRRLQTPTSWLILGGAIGVIYAMLFNLPVGSVVEFIEGGPLLICLVSWMVVVWLCVGVVLASRLYVAGLFFEAGKSVSLDPYDQSPLEPFARAGMGDMLFVVGVLVLTTVQSIDATFRYENYLYALAVALPAALVLLLRPMASIHTRLKACKRDELAAVNALIGAAPKALRQDEIAALEPLLKRRDRVGDISTRPINTSMMSRLIVYGVIPPVAWTAAAFVELLIEDLFGG